MLNNNLTFDLTEFVKLSISGQQSTYNVAADPRKTLQCKTEVTKAGIQRSVVKISADTATTRFASSGDSITGRAGVSAALTLSFPKSQDDSVVLDKLIAEITAALADSAFVAAIKNGEA